MSDQRRFRDYGARHQHIAAKLFGLLQGGTSRSLLKLA